MSFELTPELVQCCPGYLEKDADGDVECTWHEWYSDYEQDGNRCPLCGREIVTYVEMV